MSNYKENSGSQWHKWDLHVHTPASGLNNLFGGESNVAWDKFVQTLFRTAIDNEVAVIGITDYFLIDGYKKIRKDYLANDTKLLSLFADQSTVNKVKQIRLLPNIEFRLETFVDNSRINYHVIFSDELAIEDIEDDFLRKLSIKIDQSTDGTQHTESVTRRGLEKLGETLKRQDARFTGSPYEVGCGNATVSADEIRKVLANSKFHEKYIIATPVDEDLCKVSWLSQGHNLRKNYYQHSHAFFTSNQKTHDFALGKNHKSPEEYLAEFVSFKPCFIGSDSHSIADIEQKLGQWDTNRNDQSRITWIKADTTFDGLRQTLYEPETRVRIQPSHPEPKAPMHVISSVSFKSMDGTFNPNQRILLNENLNTIIGGKSSGKSLLLYSMAKAINRTQVEDYYKTLHLDGYDFIPDFVLEWKDGKKDSFTSREPSHTITYIPQLYINHLAEKKNAMQLDEFILELLQQNPDFRLQYDEFRNSVLQFDSNIQELLNKMFASLDERRRISQELAQTGLPEALTKSVESLKQQIRDITEKSTLTEQEKQQHAAVLQQLEHLSKSVNQYKACIEFLSKLESLLQEKIISLVGYDTDNDEHVPGDVDNLFAYYNTGIPQDLEMLVNTIREELTEKLRFFVNSIHELTYQQKLNSALQQQQQQTALLTPITKKIEGQKDIVKLQENLSVLNDKLSKAVGLVKQQETAKKQFAEFRKNIAKLLSDRYRLYVGLAESINTTYSDIDTDIHLNATVGLIREEFSLYNVINKQRTPNSLFNAIFPDGNSSVNYAYVPQFFTEIKSIKDSVVTFRDGTTCFVNKNVGTKQLFTAITENSFKLNFDVKYKSDSLHKMSPGKKGTVLLILFLQISSAGYPILIDQPEDNLDNRTIYTQLCTMIKRKKSERQIVIVTHNANLVVGTDSENVIVANQEGQSGTGAKQQYRFEYVNGPIENSFKDDKEQNELQYQGIREHICDILEGGLEAFENRERKYGFRR